MTPMYGCHNKLPEKGYWTMQRNYDPEGRYVLKPVYIAHNMSTDCQWSKTHTSPRCDGCIRRSS